MRMLRGLMARLKRPEDQLKLLQEKTTSIVWIIVSFLLVLLTLPTLIQPIPVYSTKKLTGRIMSLYTSEGEIGSRSFTVELSTHPGRVFEIEQLTEVNDIVFSVDAKKISRFDFWVDGKVLNSGENPVPVYGVKSYKAEYLKYHDLYFDILKDRIFVALFGFLFLVFGLMRIQMFLKELNTSKREDEKPDEEQEIVYDRLLVHFAKRPSVVIGFSSGFVFLYLLILFRGDNALYSGIFSLFLAGAGNFLVWYKKRDPDSELTIMIERIKLYEKTRKEKAEAQRTKTELPREIKLLQKLVQVPDAVNKVNSQGRSALHLAALSGSPEGVDMLLNHGAKINVKDNSGITPLMLAAQKNFQGVVSRLLKSGADAASADSTGKTAVHYAEESEKKNEGMILSLKKAAETDPEIVSVAGTGNLVQVQAMLKSGWDIDAREIETGRTVLMAAIQSDAVKLVEFLLHAGADLTLKDEDGKTAFDYARELDNGEIHELLMQKKNAA